MALHEDYEYMEAAPDLEDYMHLRKASGLSPITAAQAQPAIGNCFCFIHIRTKSTKQPVAMGRIIGDGGWYFHIVDIATLPEHQKKGLAQFIMTQLMKYIQTHSAEPNNCYVSLNADAPGRKLYEKFGFKTSEKSICMTIRPDQQYYDTLTI